MTETLAVVGADGRTLTEGAEVAAAINGHGIVVGPIDKIVAHRQHGAVEILDRDGVRRSCIPAHVVHLDSLEVALLTGTLKV